MTALVLTVALPPRAGAQTCSLDTCVDKPISILFAGNSSQATSFWTQLTSDATGCGGGCWEYGVDFSFTQRDMDTALANEDPSFFRDFDIIVFGSVRTTVDDTEMLAANWQDVIAPAPRAILTGLHLDGHTDMHAFRQVSRDMVQWLAEWTCACPASESSTPAVLALSDWRDRSSFPAAVPYSWLPWPGVRQSARPTNCTGSLGYNDTEILISGPWGSGRHPAFVNVGDDTPPSCTAGAYCTLDDAGQSVHHTWKQAVPGGYEDDGFASALIGQPAPHTRCVDVGPPDCDSVPWDGIQAALVRETCCPDPVSVCDEVTYIPFFREDGLGNGNVGTLLSFHNPNEGAVDILVHFFSRLGVPLYVDMDADLDPDFGCSGKLLTVNGRGNLMLPDLLTRFRLVDEFNVALPMDQSWKLGSIIVETLGKEVTEGVHEPVPHCVKARSYVLGNNAFPQNPNGFQLTAQVETSEFLTSDIFVNVKTGTGTNINVGEYLSIQNPVLAPMCGISPGAPVNPLLGDPELEASFELTLRDVVGAHTFVSPVTSTIPPNGIFLFLTADSTTEPGLPCEPNDVGLGFPGIVGSATVQAVPNTVDIVRPIVGASLVFDNGQCGDPLPMDSSQDPLQSADLRTDHRR